MDPVSLSAPVSVPSYQQELAELCAVASSIPGCRIDDDPDVDWPFGERTLDLRFGGKLVGRLILWPDRWLYLQAVIGHGRRPESLHKSDGGALRAWLLKQIRVKADELQDAAKHAAEQAASYEAAMKNAGIQP